MNCDHSNTLLLVLNPLQTSQCLRPFWGYFSLKWMTKLFPALVQKKSGKYLGHLNISYYNKISKYVIFQFIDQNKYASTFSYFTPKHHVSTEVIHTAKQKMLLKQFKNMLSNADTP